MILSGGVLYAMGKQCNALCAAIAKEINKPMISLTILNFGRNLIEKFIENSDKPTYSYSNTHLH